MRNLTALETLVAEHPFLIGLRREFREFVYTASSVQRFAAHQRIFREGADADHFYLIIEGVIALGALIPGNSRISIQCLGPGELLGWSWLFPPHKWHFTATTRAPTEMLSFDVIALRAKAEQNPEFCNELLAGIARTLYDRLLHTQQRLIETNCVRL